jgi:hypothetical protein
MTDAYLLVFSNPADGREDDYNVWYDTVHLPEVLRVDGIVSAQRFDHSPIGSAAADGARYLAVYGVTGDPDAALHALNTQVASGEIRMSDGLDRASLRLAVVRARSAKTPS